MSQHTIENLVFFILLAGALLLLFFIFEPFLYTLVLAIIFAVLFDPWSRFLKKQMPHVPGVAALLAVLTVLVTVLVPLGFLGFQFYREITEAYFRFEETGGAAGLVATMKTVVDTTLQNYTPFSLSTLNITDQDINAYVSGFLAWLSNNLGTFFSSVLNIVINFFILLVALYYVFKDGPRAKQFFVNISPIRPHHQELIFDRLHTAINSVIRGSLVVAVVQGIIAGIGFGIFGVPNPILWGGTTAVAALIPGVGTSLVLIPAIVYLFVTGATAHGVGLMLWGLTAVGLIDNFLGPKLIEQKLHIHPFLILLSVLGGLSLFGPLGFLIGPLVLSLCYGLLEIYNKLFEHAV